jgi:ArsR family transcriptional regulator, arsenate/arsenite/antimonite-responsive transcriptional repressor
MPPPYTFAQFSNYRALSDHLTSSVYFDIYKNMEKTTTALDPTSVERIAETFAALGQISRLQIVRLLLSAYPKGLPAGEIQQNLGISAPTLSHHLDKLRQVGLLTMEKDRQWIWYSIRAETLKQLIDFFYAECCTRNQVVQLEESQLPTKSNNNSCC